MWRARGIPGVFLLVGAPISWGFLLASGCLLGRGNFVAVFAGAWVSWTPAFACRLLWGFSGLRGSRFGLLSRGLEVGKPSRRSLDSCVLEAPGNMFGAFFWLRGSRFRLMFSGL